jgi:hypothetical protein
MLGLVRLLHQRRLAGMGACCGIHVLRTISGQPFNSYTAYFARHRIFRARDFVPPPFQDGDVAESAAPQPAIALQIVPVT